MWFGRFPFQNLEARVAHVTLPTGRRMAAHQELEALPQRVQSPRYVIADAVGNALQGIPVVWPVIALKEYPQQRGHSNRTSVFVGVAAPYGLRRGCACRVACRAQPAGGEGRGDTVRPTRLRDG